MSTEWKGLRKVSGVFKLEKKSLTKLFDMREFNLGPQKQKEPHETPLKLKKKKKLHNLKCIR